MSARANFSPKYCSAVSGKAVKPMVFIYHEAISIFLGLKMP